jgi:hypothetical protein
MRVNFLRQDASICVSRTASVARGGKSRRVRDCGAKARSLTGGALALAGVWQFGDVRPEIGRYAGDPATLQKIEKTLAAARIEFIDENGGGPGVRLRKPSTRRRSNRQTDLAKNRMFSSQHGAYSPVTVLRRGAL